MLDAAIEKPVETDGTRRLPGFPTAVGVIAVMVPLWLRHLIPATNPRDFFADWMSAHDLIAGLPSYRRLTDAPLLFGLPKGFFADHSPHPPASALLMLPFGLLAYPTALFAWNVTGLVLLGATVRLIARELGWAPDRRTATIAFAALLGWVPLWEVVEHGQSGLVLAWLVALAWRSVRRGRESRAGLALAVATSLKLYPGLLVGYLAILGRVRTVFACAVATAVLSVAITAVAGADVWTRFLEFAPMELERWRSNWSNASVVGYFARLFHPDGNTVPVIASPLLAQVATLAATACVIALTVGCCVRDRRDVDRGFALTITAAMVMSVVTWQSYFVVLLLPLAVALSRLPGERRGWLATLALTWLLMDVPERQLCGFVLGDGPAPAWASVTFVSLNFYGLVGFLVWQALAWRHALGARTRGPA